jgi:hypothetical protein
MTEEIRFLVVHEFPHFDEILGIWLLHKFGEKKYPGVKKAKIVFSGTGGELPPGLRASDYEQAGFLYIGTGGGKFDEHAKFGKAAKEGECAASLIAKDLKVEEEPGLEKILKFAEISDLGGSQPFDLSNIIKVLYRQYQDQPEKVISWAFMAIEAFYEDQARFLNETQKEFRKAQIEIIETSKGPLKMAVIVSDDEQVNKFARSELGGNCALVIQKRNSGNVQIFTNKRKGISLREVVIMLRRSEQEKKGQVLETSPSVLGSGGKIEAVPEWFYHQTGEMLLNGSLTAKKVPPTKIPLAEIKEIVKRVLSLKV